MSKKYIITLLKNDYGSDGHNIKFITLYQCNDLKEAKSFLNDNIDRMIKEELNARNVNIIHEGRKWKIVEQRKKVKKNYGIIKTSVNESNKVVYSISKDIKSGGGFESVTYCYEIIEFNIDQKVSNNLFKIEPDKIEIAQKVKEQQ